jgi:hypothetical protein
MMRSIRSCHRGEVIYTPQVRLNWSFVWLCLLAVLAYFGAGCGGINASKSVSPASFFLPGIMKAVPPPSVETTNQFAFAQ